MFHLVAHTLISTNGCHGPSTTLIKDHTREVSTCGGYSRDLSTRLLHLAFSSIVAAEEPLAPCESSHHCWGGRLNIRPPTHYSSLSPPFPFMPSNFSADVMAFGSSKISLL